MTSSAALPTPCYLPNSVGDNDLKETSSIPKAGIQTEESLNWFGVSILASCSSLAGSLLINLPFYILERAPVVSPVSMMVWSTSCVLINHSFYYLGEEAIKKGQEKEGREAEELRTGASLVQTVGKISLYVLAFKWSQQFYRAASSLPLGSICRDVLTSLPSRVIGHLAAGFVAYQAVGCVFSIIEGVLEGEEIKKIPSLPAFLTELVKQVSQKAISIFFLLKAVNEVVAKWNLSLPLAPIMAGAIGQLLAQTILQTNHAAASVFGKEEEVLDPSSTGVVNYLRSKCWKLYRGGEWIAASVDHKMSEWLGIRSAKSLSDKNIPFYEYSRLEAIRTIFNEEVKASLIELVPPLSGTLLCKVTVGSAHVIQQTLLTIKVVTFGLNLLTRYIDWNKEVLEHSRVKEG